MHSGGGGGGGGGGEGTQWCVGCVGVWMLGGGVRMVGVCVHGG